MSAGVVTFGVWSLTILIKGNPIINFCLLGGALGSLTHIWAVYRGIVTKPPMLQGASPLGAVGIAFFEHIYYWCIILTFAMITNWIWIKLQGVRHASK